MDNIFKTVGENLLFQKILIYILITGSFLVSILALSYSFFTKMPDFLCKLKNSTSNSYQNCDYYIDNICSITSPYDFIINKQTSLNNWVSNFNLYCDKEYYIPILGSSYFFGAILGSIFITPLPDKYGRQKIFNICFIILCVLYLNLLLIYNEIHLLIITFLCGIISAVYGIFNVIISEFIPKNISGIVMSFTNAIYPLLGVVLSIFFMTVNNWRIFILALTILQFITTFLAIKYFPESPRWLITQGKKEECLESFKQIAKYNNRTNELNKLLNENNIEELLQSKTNSRKKEYKNVNLSIIEIFNFKSQRKTLLILILLWFGSAFCFYGIILNLSKISNNFFIDAIYAFIGEMISEIISGYLSNIFGRVILLELGGFFGSIGFILYFILYNSNYHIIKSSFMFISMFGYSSTFNVIYIYTPEILPTVIRGNVSEFLFLFSRIAPFSIPVITSLIGKWMNVLFILMGFAYALACLGLKETLNDRLDEDIPELILIDNLLEEPLLEKEEKNNNILKNLE